MPAIKLAQKDQADERKHPTRSCSRDTLPDYWDSGRRKGKFHRWDRRKAGEVWMVVILGFDVVILGVTPQLLAPSIASKLPVLPTVSVQNNGDLTEQRQTKCSIMKARQKAILQLASRHAGSEPGLLS
ncbi:hypothetical protein F5Y03DRAFT_399062 [Xylaria venustula]|nr:hypothetical protein F5Y03DRAFT_399062 [Xylaria venustula]